MPTAYKRPKAKTNYRHKREESIQLRVCRYIRINYPDVIFISDFAAGLDLTNLQRIKMSKMRSDDGQPDISIDFPSRGYHGLRLELKADGEVIYKKDGTLRQKKYKRTYKMNGKVFIKTGDHLAEQAAMLEKYNNNGYLGRFAIGYDNAIRMVDWYLNRQGELF